MPSTLKSQHFSPLFSAYRQELNKPRPQGSTPFLHEVINNELLGLGEFVEPHLRRTLASLGIMKHLNVSISQRLTQQGTLDEQLGLDPATEGLLKQVLKMRGINLPTVFPQAMSQERVQTLESAAPTPKLNKKLKF